MHSSSHSMAAGSPTAAAHWSCLTPTAEAIGSRSSTEITAMTAVPIIRMTVHRLTVATSVAPTPR